MAPSVKETEQLLRKVAARLRKDAQVRKAVKTASEAKPGYFVDKTTLWELIRSE